MSAPGRLERKRALVTGVTSGIGAAVAKSLVESGARVVGVGRDPGRLQAVSERLGPQFQPLLADLAEPAARRSAVAELGSEPFQLLVNNAAECVYESLAELPAARLSRLFEINVSAVLEFVQAVAPTMPAGALIVNVSSVVARHLPSAKFAAYASTKAALDCLSEALRLELHPRGVQVSTVRPGLVDTPIYDKVDGFERVRQKLHEQVPTWLTPEDVADAILWIAGRPAHSVISELTILPSAQAR
jgi:3-hydroxy acid dehydrogenase/malonic semialdehyde reductase